MHISSEEFWDLDLRVEPARDQRGPMEMSFTTETTFTLTKIVSRLPTACANPTDTCRVNRPDARG